MNKGGKTDEKTRQNQLKNDEKNVAKPMIKIRQNKFKNDEKNKAKPIEKEGKNDQKQGQTR